MNFQMADTYAHIQTAIFPDEPEVSFARWSKGEARCHC